MLVSINLTGGDYKEKSRPLNKQVTRNFFPKQSENVKSASPYILQTFYGLKLLSSINGGNGSDDLFNRGMARHKGRAYRIVNTGFYEIDQTGAQIKRGTIPGYKRCIITYMGDFLLIANGQGEIYTWNGGILEKVVSPNLGMPNGVAALNNQAIYDRGTGQIFDVSDVGKPNVINGLNFASAESDADDLVIPYVFREVLYLFGTRTVELWYNSGQGNPPFDRIQGAIIQQGLGAIYSVATSSEFLFFFGDDNQFHSLTYGSSAVDSVISTKALTREISQYTVVDDCISWTMELEGQWFYVATFPSENITWVYTVGGEWFQWGTGLHGRIRADSYIYVFGKHLVADQNNGNLYELDSDTYTDGGEPIYRVRDSAPIHGGLFQKDGVPFEINRIEFFLETGVGVLQGQGVQPVIMMSTSKDGGKTFGTERQLKIGRLGHQVRVVTSGLGRFPETCVIRIRTSDPVFYAIYSASAFIDFAV